MKPECLECEATLALALERVKRLEAAAQEARHTLFEVKLKLASHRMFSSEEMLAWARECENAEKSLTNALRPEGT